MCGTMKQSGLLVSQCSDYDAWGYAGVCGQRDVFTEKQFTPPKILFGGDTDIFDEGINFYSIQEYPPNIVVFDDKSLFGPIPSQTLVIGTTADAIYNEQGVIIPA